MIENWHEEYQQLDVSIQDGRLVLSQGSDTPQLSFEEQLGCLGRKWTEIVDNVESRKTEAENIAKNWWDFSKSKLRMMKWMERKENDLERESDGGGDLENAVLLEKKFKVWFLYLRLIVEISLIQKLISDT